MDIERFVRLGATRRVMVAALVVGAGCVAVPGMADDEAPANQTIAASVNVPAPDLSCDEAAAQARVTFRVLNAPFEVRRVSVFIDGQGLPESAVEQAWPAVAVTQGLHPGRNLVELIAYGPDNQSIDRKQTVLIGVEPVSDDIAPAQIECEGGASADSGQPPSEPDQLPDTDQQAGMDQAPGYQATPPPDEPPPVEQAVPYGQPAYVEGPIYSYYPAPVFLGPVYSSGYFAPPPVYYAPAPPLFFYDRGGGRHRRYDFHDRGEPQDHGGYSGRRDYGPPSGGSFGRPAPNGGTAVQTPQRGTFNTYSPPHYADPGAAHAVQQQPQQRPDFGGVRPSQPFNPRPAPAPMPNRESPQQQPRQMPQPAPIQHSGVPAAPAAPAPARQTPRWAGSVQHPQQH